MRKLIECSDCKHFEGYSPLKDVCDKERECIKIETETKGKTNTVKTTYKYFSKRIKND